MRQITWRRHSIIPRFTKLSALYRIPRLGVDKVNDLAINQEWGTHIGDPLAVEMHLPNQIDAYLLYYATFQLGLQTSP